MTNWVYKMVRRGMIPAISSGVMHRDCKREDHIPNDEDAKDLVGWARRPKPHKYCHSVAGFLYFIYFCDYVLKRMNTPEGRCYGR